jgi:hypothetical protein
MMPLSRSMHFSEGPITMVPYDVLVEIFIHCLSHHPLQIQQPNTRVAPMLLCQICSCWRTVALATPSLWSHLLYCFSPQSIDRELGTRAFHQQDLDFMMWWKGRQGSIAPFLYLEIKTDTQTEKIPLAKDGMDFVLRYMTSARYLRANSLFWKYIHDEFAVGEQQVIFPDPHTLMTDPQNPHFYRAQVLIGLVPAHTSSALRRLFIDASILPMDAIAPNHWSKLTHLATLNVTLSVTSWFCLIRALPDLEWASISFGFCNEYNVEDGPPSKYTLPRLSTLFLTCCEHWTDDVALPFALLLTSLYLPALQTLSLLSLAESWEDDLTISELYTVLHSMPSVTTLALRGCANGFLSLHKPDYPAILSMIGDIEPIWRHAPHLTHLQLDLPSITADSDGAGEILDTSVRNFFWPDCGWLALDNLACPIRRVTFIAGHAWYPKFDTIRELTLSSILNHAGEVSDIIFEIVSKAAVDDTGSEAWWEWGSRNE